ncbi:hypothetical protein RP20_CCG004245 [Aedes albopictus]|nr:hypothetical protein RP20_CCG004245 [Aedes albopictus]
MADHRANKSSNESSSEVCVNSPRDSGHISIKNLLFFQQPSKLDINSYATRKTFVQGMLDLALLTANAAQLKYLLTVGEAHPFYTFLIALVVTSISLQSVRVTSFYPLCERTLIGHNFAKSKMSPYRKKATPEAEDSKSIKP